MALILGKRLLVAFPTLLGVTFLAFFLIRFIPGDPVLMLLGERGASPELIAEMRAKLGLDLPLYEQYFLFLKNALGGDLGVSIVSNESVVSEFWARFPATLELGLFAMIFAVAFGIPFGVIAAAKRNTPFDYCLMGGSLVGYSMPIFWWGLVLIFVFSVTLGWTPVSGRIGFEFDVPVLTGFLLVDTLLVDDNPGAFFSALQHLVLPALAMGTIPLAAIARMTRSSMLEILGQDYMRTARAKGLSQSRVIITHGLRNALIPIVTIVGLMVGGVVTGAILTETIFSWPGIGKWLVQSVVARDYPVIQGGVLFVAMTIVMVNLIVDLMYVFINPKLRS